MNDKEIDKKLKETGTSHDSPSEIIKTKPTAWWVRFTPIGDSTVLGPFESQEQAKKAEQEYLLAQL